MPKTTPPIKQQLIFTMTHDADQLKINLEFEPGIIGMENPKIAEMSAEQRAIQNYAGHIANHVMDALQKDQEPSEGLQVGTEYKTRSGHRAIVLHVDTNPRDGELGARVWYAEDDHLEWICEKTGRVCGNINDDHANDIVGFWESEANTVDTE